MSDRILAKVVTVDQLLPIEGADRIELALVGGWQVVVQKGLYVPNYTKAVYFEVDSLLDTSRPYFTECANWSSKLLHVVDGVTHARVKTMKLRKQLSQGYMIPLSETGNDYATVGFDMTKLLGVTKYEKVEEKSMNDEGGTNTKSGFRALGFPKFVPKTDQTRVQNITAMYNAAVENGELFEKTFKLDGSSMTVFVNGDTAGVASRNVGFRRLDEKRSFFATLKDWLLQKRPLMKKEWKRIIKADDNAFTQMERKLGLIEAIWADGRNLAIQGELVGPSIQKNFEGVAENSFYCYDIFNIDEQTYLSPQERQEWCAKHNVPHVPLGSPHAVTLPVDVAACLADADGPSGLNGKYREGFVYKSMSRDFSFKAISNTYLLKEE